MKKKMPDKPIDELILDLKSQAVFVKKTAILQLEKKRAKVAVPALTGLSKDTEASIRGCAAWAIGELGDSKSQQTLVDLLKDMDASVRRAAAQGLAKIGAEESLEGLEGVCIDSDRYVREAALDAKTKIAKRLGGSAEKVNIDLPESVGKPRKRGRTKTLTT
jgi:HEAT repeat protein